MEPSDVSGVVDFLGADEWSQQVEYRDIKAQQQLTKPHYGSPAGPSSTPSPLGLSTEEIQTALTLEKSGLSEMEKLSRDYRPNLQGPLVGELRSSKALEVEYASADPAFVRKTAALSPKYPHYRTILGDGNCGWRAVAFGFFELLLRSGDANHIGMQYARIVSLDGLMSVAGFQGYIYEDFAEVTRELLETILSPPVIANPWDVSVIVNRFNNSEVADAIITHFKFMTSAWMKTRPEYYQPFLDCTVKQFCETQIEPYAIEIEHVGLMALIDCLVLPAAFAVEVFYLDRSAGDEVNVHRFEDLSPDGIPTPPDAPVLRLLYRPGHYDIIYKTEDITPAIPLQPPQPLQVSFLENLPEQTFAETPLNLFEHCPAIGMDFFPVASDPSNFRPSQFNQPSYQPPPPQTVPFQTTTFRNSPFNPSHYQSEHFQPEIYQPPTSGSAKRSASVEKQLLNMRIPGSYVWDAYEGQYPTDEYLPDQQHPSSNN